MQISIISSRLGSICLASEVRAHQCDLGDILPSKGFFYHLSFLKRDSRETKSEEKNGIKRSSCAQTKTALTSLFHFRACSACSGKMLYKLTLHGSLSSNVIQQHPTSINRFNRWSKVKIDSRTPGGGRLLHGWSTLSQLAPFYLSFLSLFTIHCRIQAA